MGYIRHHTIIVVSGYHDPSDKDRKWDDGRLVKAHDKAKEIFGNRVSEIIEPQVNGECSFFVGPDGSKEGWNASEEGNQQRAKFIEWLRSNSALYLDWIEVEFGGDGGVGKITND